MRHPAIVQNREKHIHKLPGRSPSVETALRRDELITAVTMPAPKFSKNAYYLKVRDRNSYAFALLSVAAGLELDGQTVKSAGIALGGVALKPWRKEEAENALKGKTASPEAFASAAEILLAGADARLNRRMWTATIGLPSHGSVFVVASTTVTIAGTAGRRIAAVLHVGIAQLCRLEPRRLLLIVRLISVATLSQTHRPPYLLGPLVAAAALRSPSFCALVCFFFGLQLPFSPADLPGTGS